MNPARFSRRLALAGLASLAQLTSCNQPASPSLTRGPIVLTEPVWSREHEGALYFDERYLDSLYVQPRSPRIARELAIKWELGRLRLATRSLGHPGNKLSDSVTASGRPDGPLVHYRSNAVLLAEIYRRIDSLKVLEHLPVTPH